ncbi:hypothetical protein [uncultured Anaerovibrio sp.]|uniref:hypothetical protein n=1 Tax=uncultured Anaerovibrio sp. TaxID=361586 RepID=UPI0025EEF9B7|nr:hypothetical protein [uncultured Anaerovibrio sp.]
MNKEKAAAIKKHIADLSSKEERAGKKPMAGTTSRRSAIIAHEQKNVQDIRLKIQSEAADVLLISQNDEKIEPGTFRWQEPAFSKEIHNKQKGIVKNIAAAKKNMEQELRTVEEACQNEKIALEENFHNMVQDIAMLRGKENED